MARSSNGRHHISRRTKIAAGGAVLAIAAGTLVVITTAGEESASADGADKSLFVDITKVKPNVRTPRNEDDASRGTFTVNCGTNGEEHFNPDNFIAAPGVRNGAEHLHDYVGNLSTNADSNNRSLLRAGTTCRNGDSSTYFWPVVRIDEEDKQESNSLSPAKKAARAQQQSLDKQSKAAPRLDCPDIASQLPDVPDQAMAQVNKQLAALDKQFDEFDKKLEAGQNVLAALAEQRKIALDQIALALTKPGQQPMDLGKLVPCLVKDQKSNGIDNGDENSDNDPAVGAQLAAEDDNGELPGNDGELQRPVKAELTFRGSPVGNVTAMPRFLRVLYGDAKVSINGTKNARASWTCEGFENKVLLNKYVICPSGKSVKRIHDFPNCWDGENIDSENHRTHIVFPDRNGRCNNGFRRVPQLRITLTYDIPRDIQKNGEYKVDSFPDEDHDPFTDHDDFANVMRQDIMNRVVNCINRDKNCKE